MAKRKRPLFEPFQRITGVKKVIRCKSCGKKIEVSNFNRELCSDCGYRGDRRKMRVEEKNDLAYAEA